MALTRKEISRNFYRRRKDNGLCTRCGRELDRKGHYCSECLLKIRKYTRENKEFYRKNHICTECGKVRVYGSDKICFECRAKKNNRKKPLTDKQKDNFRKQQNSLYQQRSEQGICTRCGKRKAAIGRKKCDVCLEEDRVRHRRKREENTKIYRRENHLCYHCGEPIDLENGQLCSKCLEICRQNGYRSTSNNDYWRMDNNIIFKNNR